MVMAISNGQCWWSGWLTGSLTGWLLVTPALVQAENVIGAAALGQQPDPIERLAVFAKRDELQGFRQYSGFGVEADSQLSLNRTMADWLADIPGVSLNGQGGLYQAYSIRGLSRFRIQTLYNGIPVYTDRNAGNGMAFLPPALLAEVAVEPGSSSSLYGSQAMGGVVLLSSPQLAQPMMAVEASSVQQSVTFGTRWDAPTSNGQTQINWRRASNDFAADGTELNSGFEQGALTFDLSHDTPEANIASHCLLSYSKDVGKNGRDLTEQITYYPQDQHSLCKLEISDNDKYLFRLYHHYQHWSSDVLRLGKRRNITAYQGHTLGGLWYTSAENGLGAWRLGVESSNRLGVKVAEQELSIGGELNYAKTFIDGDQYNLAGFAEQQWQLTDQWQLLLGGRFDWVRQQQGGQQPSVNRQHQQWSSQANIKWTPSNEWQSNLSLATGFRFASLSELYFAGQTPRGVTVGNPDLANEKTLQAEWQWRWQQQNRVWQWQLYYTHLDDYIERYRLADQSRTYRNVDSAMLRGVELSVLQPLTDNLALTVNYHWQQGMILAQGTASGRDLADIGPARLGLGMRYTSAIGDWHSQWQYRRAHNAVGDGESPLASVVLWQLGWSYQTDEHYLWQVNGLNLLNKNDYTSADDSTGLQPGASLQLRLSYQW